MQIIAVDDEHHALTGIARLIKKVIPGSEPACFDTSEEALSFAKEHQVDIAFLDINMSGMNGLELAKHLNDIYKRTNIIFITGYMEYALDAYEHRPSDFLLKPISEAALKNSVDNLRYPVLHPPDNRIKVRTFGNFEVLANGVPVHFPRSKSKELFAYLIHKNGTSCNIRELAAVLEDSSENNVRKYISDMTVTLKESGYDDIIVKGYNNICVDTEKINCDLYRFFKQDPEAISSYTGEYMSNYSWAEATVKYLDDKV